MLTWVYFYALHTFIICNYILKNDILKLFSLTCHKFYETVMKNYVSNIETSKEPNKTRESSVTCSHIWHVNISKCVYWLDIQSVKVWWRYPKKRNEIKGRFTTCSYIWHVDVSKYVYWLYTHSVKVWWR